jgi:hypothetical protein
MQFSLIRTGYTPREPNSLRVGSYIEFANQSERYDDMAAYLTSRDVRRRLKP